ncbi:MAG TPA: hypothetical protein PKV67_00975 [Hyphomonas sp.]|nr:hypothetical protein [Hyphomonas sp.]
MSISQAVLAVALWQTREFDTMQIAQAIGAKEADVCRAVHAAREAVRCA